MTDKVKAKPPKPNTKCADTLCGHAFKRHGPQYGLGMCDVGWNTWEHKCGCRGFIRKSV